MASDSDDDESFVVFGTRLHQEEDAGARRHEFQKKDVAAAGNSKSMPVWKQEAVDSEGRQRFHGAFTGGFSAGYYNSVGSAEGWAPAAFRSSRSDRAASRKQEVNDFLDEDERADAAAAAAVAIAPGFDTFGAAAAAAARDAADAEAAARSKEAIPGLLPEELLAPVAESLGIQLLQKLGWRQGRGIGAAVTTGRGRGGSRWGRAAGTAPDPVPVFAPPAKNDAYGLGFDPFKDAEVFRAAKAARGMPPTRAAPTKQRPRGVAFGVGVDDTDELYGMVDDYVSHEPSMRRSTLHTQVAGSDDEEDGGPQLLLGGRARQQGLLEGRAAPLGLTLRPAPRGNGFALPGYVAGELLPPPSFPPPLLPPGFSGRHVFPPTPPPPPRVGRATTAEAKRRELAAGLAVYAAQARLAAAAAPGRRSAPLRECDDAGATRDLLAGSHPGAKSSESPVSNGPPQPRAVVPRRDAAGNAAAAGNAPALGQAAPLAAGLMNAAAVLQSSFVRGSTQDMPAETGGLWRPEKVPTPAAAAVAPPGGIAFAPASSAPPAPAAAASGAVVPAGTPQRTVSEWRPVPLLCKRLNVADPYRGRPPPAEKAAAVPWTLADLGQARAGDEGYQALPLPPPPQQQQQSPQQALPPPPQRQQHQPPAGADGMQEAAKEADDFLAGLGLPPPPAPPPPAQQSATRGPPTSATAQPAAAPQQALPAQVPLAPLKPMDLFKAVFEAPESSEDEGESSDGEDKQQQRQELLPGPLPPAVPATVPAPVMAGSAGAAAAAAAGPAAAPPAGLLPGLLPSSGHAAVAGGEGVTKAAIEAALRKLKGSRKQKRKKHKKEKEKRSSKRRRGNESEVSGDSSGSKGGSSGEEQRRSSKHKSNKIKHKSKKDR